jgi:hypothetical protein
MKEFNDIDKRKQYKERVQWESSILRISR